MGGVTQHEIDAARERLVLRIGNRREAMRRQPEHHYQQAADRRHVEHLETLRLLSDQLSLIADRLATRPERVEEQVDDVSFWERWGQGS